MYTINRLLLLMSYFRRFLLWIVYKYVVTTAPQDTTDLTTQYFWMAEAQPNFVANNN